VGEQKAFSCRRPTPENKNRIKYKKQVKESRRSSAAGDPHLKIKINKNKTISKREQKALSCRRPTFGKFKILTSKSPRLFSIQGHRSKTFENF
jgi:hypothetical protein